VRLARCGTVFHMSVVARAVVPAAVCRCDARAVLVWGGVSRINHILSAIGLNRAFKSALCA